jgi:hypothetical protein
MIPLAMSGCSLSDAWQMFAYLVPSPAWIHVLAAFPATFTLLLLASVVGSTAYKISVIMLDGAIAALFGYRKAHGLWNVTYSRLSGISH